MTTNSIHNAFVNALLADATYVDGLAPNGIGLDKDSLARELGKRLTPALAQYLADHFEVVAQKLTDDVLGSGFDATVWREKDTGQIYLSTRGTEGIADFVADGDLTTSGLARKQVMDMVNWWLQGRAAEGSQAAQIKFKMSVDEHGVETETNEVIAAPTATGTGKFSAFNSVIVNGHSLGGHLATAFTRLFSDSIRIIQTYTYNSATFNPFSPTRFSEIAAALGLGQTNYPTSDADTNFRAMHGPDLTTQNLTAGQIGLRVDLFNEESTDTLTVPNHFMYKLTDALAHGDAMEKLDPTLTLNQLNILFEAGSNRPIASIEGTRDMFGADAKGVALTGFTLPQQDALEHYCAWLKNNNKLPPGSKLNATGCSLGGNLATVFTEIHQNDPDIQFGETVTMNGAGRGQWDFSVGSPESMVSYYHRVLNDPTRRRATR